MGHETFMSRTDWLTARQRGIGASEAAAIVGMSPWVTPTDLWRQKIGEEKSKEIEGNPAIDRGNKMEPILRTFYESIHEEAAVHYVPYRLTWQDERPWLFATLDGVIERHDGELGILEIKTAAPTGKLQWGAWKESVPEHYYVQVLHQFAATNYSFAVLFAALFERDGSIVLREYEFERDECKDDIEWLIGHEDTFWRHAQDRTIPPVILKMG